MQLTQDEEWAAFLQGIIYALAIVGVLAVAAMFGGCIRTVMDSYEKKHNRGGYERKRIQVGAERDVGYLGRHRRLPGQDGNREQLQDGGSGEPDKSP